MSHEHIIVIAIYVFYGISQIFWMCQSLTLFSLFLADILSLTLARGSCLWIPIVENSKTQVLYPEYPEQLSRLSRSPETSSRFHQVPPIVVDICLDLTGQLKLKTSRDISIILSICQNMIYSWSVNHHLSCEPFLASFNGIWKYLKSKSSTPSTYDLENIQRARNLLNNVGSFMIFECQWQLQNITLPLLFQRMKDWAGASPSCDMFWQVMFDCNWVADVSRLFAMFWHRPNFRCSIQQHPSESMGSSDGCREQH